MLLNIAQIVVGLAVLAMLVATALPFWRAHYWWVRVCDFPRAQLAIAGAILLPLCWILPTGGWRAAAMLAVATALAYQIARILPFTPLWRKEIRLVEDTDAGHFVTLMASNVLMENEEHAKLIALIEDADPDVLFLMETDGDWDDALRDTLSRYPTILREVKDDYYGMIFATRLETVRAEIVYLSQDETPTLFAELKTPDGSVFRFVGLHPKPPVPGDDTDDRDAEVLYAALFARKTDIPLVMMGDFNDAAWSHTSREFKRIGGYLDPRVGRGMIASFDANSRLMRAPIDQLFVTPEVAVAGFSRGPNVGSDHFPIIARISPDPALAARYNAAGHPMDEAEREEAQRAVAEYRERLRLPDFG